MGAWMRGPLKPLMEERLLQRVDLAGLPLDNAALRAWYTEHQSGRADHAWGLWLMLSLALWEDQFWKGQH